MSEKRLSDDGSTRPGHLGKTWEIAVVIAVVVVVVLSTLTVVISYRRRKHKRRQREADSEAGRMPSLSSVKRDRKSVTPWGFNSKRARQSQVENEVEPEIAKPSATLSPEPHRLSRAAYSDTSSFQKPKYYWNER